MSPHAIALSTLRITSEMRLGSASACARAPSRSLSTRSQASVGRQHFLVGSTQTRDLAIGRKAPSSYEKRVRHSGDKTCATLMRSVPTKC